MSNLNSMTFQDLIIKSSLPLSQESLKELGITGRMELMRELLKQPIDCLQSESPTHFVYKRKRKEIADDS